MKVSRPAATAASPSRAKMPAPTMAPMPIAVTDHRFIGLGDWPALLIVALSWSGRSRPA